jgi:hypothetical protein
MRVVCKENCMCCLIIWNLQLANVNSVKGICFKLVDRTRPQSFTLARFSRSLQRTSVITRTLMRSYWFVPNGHGYMAWLSDTNHQLNNNLKPSTGSYQDIKLLHINFPIMLIPPVQLTEINITKDGATCILAGSKVLLFVVNFHYDGKWWACGIVYDRVWRAFFFRFLIWPVGRFSREYYNIVSDGLQHISHSYPPKVRVLWRALPFRRIPTVIVSNRCVSVLFDHSFGILRTCWNLEIPSGRAFCLTVLTTKHSKPRCRSYSRLSTSVFSNLSFLPRNSHMSSVIAVDYPYFDRSR